jgi:hypothetical protein
MKSKFRVKSPSDLPQHFTDFSWAVLMGMLPETYHDICGEDWADLDYTIRYRVLHDRCELEEKTEIGKRACDLLELHACLQHFDGVGMTPEDQQFAFDIGEYLLSVFYAKIEHIEGTFDCVLLAIEDGKPLAKLTIHDLLNRPTWETGDE